MTRAGVTAELDWSEEGFRKGLRQSKSDYQKWADSIQKEIKISLPIGDMTAAKRMAELRGEIVETTADVKRLAAEYRKLTTQASFGAPVKQGITGLRHRGGALPPVENLNGGQAIPGFTDPAYIDRTRASMDGLTRSTLTTNTAMMQGQRGATNQGMALLMLSQMADDAQYGFRSIVNNIAPLVLALGGSTGLAGSLTIVSVLLNQGMQWWDNYTGAADRAKEAAGKVSEAYLRAGKLAAEAATLAGKKTGEEAATAAETALKDRENFDRRTKAAEDLLDQQERLAMAEATRLEGTARQRRELEITSSLEEKKAAFALKANKSQEEEARETWRLAELAAAGTREEIEALKEKELAAKKQFDQDKLTEETRNAQIEARKMRANEYSWTSNSSGFEVIDHGIKGVITDGLESIGSGLNSIGLLHQPESQTPTHQYGGDFPGVSAADAARRAALEATLPGLEKASGDRRTLLDQTTAAKQDAAQKLTDVASEKAARLKEIEIEEAKERVESLRKAGAGLTKVIESLEKSWTTMRTREEAKQQEIFQKNSQAWQDGIAKTREDFEAFSGQMRDAGNALKQELLQRQETLRKLAESSQINHLRAGRHNSRADRLQDQETVRDRTADLIKNENKSPADARAQAEQESRDRRGRVGGRIAAPKTPSPLDQDNTARGYRPPETPNLDDFRRRRDSHLARPRGEDSGTSFTPAGVSKMITDGVKTLTTLFDRLTQAVEKPVGDKIKPVNAS